MFFFIVSLFAFDGERYIESCALLLGASVRHGAHKSSYLCSSDGYTNIVVKGGVCVKHGARTRRTKVALNTRLSICKRHGATVNYL